MPYGVGYGPGEKVKMGGNKKKPASKPSGKKMPRPQKKGK